MQPPDRNEHRCLSAIRRKRDGGRNRYRSAMLMTKIDKDAAWAAFEQRDRGWDGRVIGAVTTTGIYCKPSCPARRPKRDHVRFFADAESARAAGFRACLRCKPDEVARDRAAVAKAVTLIEQAEEAPSLADLAAAVGYAPHHFQRLFTRDLGISPAAYARGLRARRATRELERNGRVTDAIYDAGYAAPSGFYADAKERLGMTPSAWRDGGRGHTIRWTTFDSPLGPMLIAATDKGICRLTFDEGEEALRRIFPNATIVRDDGSMASLVEGALAAIERPAAAAELPLDVAGTAFQEAVWRELRKIPPGETRVLRANRRRGRQARRGSRGRQRQRLQPCRGADPLPPRDPQRRLARRLCRRARAQAQIARGRGASR